MLVRCGPHRHGPIQRTALETLGQLFGHGWSIATSSQGARLEANTSRLVRLRDPRHWFSDPSETFTARPIGSVSKWEDKKHLISGLVALCAGETQSRGLSISALCTDHASPFKLSPRR